MKKISLVAALAFSLATATMPGCKGCDNDKQASTLEQVAEEQDASSGTTSDDINTSYDTGIASSTLDAISYDAGADASATKKTPTAMDWYTKLTTAIKINDAAVGSVVCEYILAEQPDKRLILSGKTARDTAQQLFDRMVDPITDDFTRTSFVFNMYSQGLKEPSHPLIGKATIVVNYRCQGGELLLK